MAAAWVFRVMGHVRIDRVNVPRLEGSAAGRAQASLNAMGALPRPPALPGSLCRGFGPSAAAVPVASWRSCLSPSQFAATS